MDSSRSGRRFPVTYLWLAAAATVVAAIVSVPVSCSQGSDDVRASCDTVLGYGTPLPEGSQTLAVVLLVLVVAAALRQARAGHS
jgi:hypothetical protein